MRREKASRQENSYSLAPMEEHQVKRCPSCVGPGREMELTGSPPPRRRRTPENAMLGVGHFHPEDPHVTRGSSRQKWGPLYQQRLWQCPTVTSCRSVLMAGLCLNLLLFQTALSFRLDEASNSIIPADTSPISPAPSLSGSKSISVFYQSGVSIAEIILAFL